MKSTALTPELESSLRPLIADAVEGALKAFFLGVTAQQRGITLEPNSGIITVADIDPADAWRKAALARYPNGTWKSSIIKIIPFARFRPNQLVHDHQKQLKAWHPTHNHITSAVANVLSWLVSDGVIAKLGTGLYAPAIDGNALV